MTAQMGRPTFISKAIIPLEQALDLLEDVKASGVALVSLARVCELIQQAREMAIRAEGQPR